MPSSSLSASQPPSRFTAPFWWAALVFAALLALVFRNSFVPELTIFSNDGPLGAISAASGKLPAGFFGVWNDLNWIGSRGIGAAPNISSLWAWLAQPVVFSKTYPPLALFLVGALAWFLFRQLGFKPAVCLLGGLAAMLNSSVFSIACWGLPAWSLSRAMTFLALAILASPGIRRPWLKPVLAGLAIGMAVMEGFDVGAIYSLYVAAWVVFLSWTEPARPAGQRLIRGAASVSLVALFAVLIAAQSLSALVSTQVQGVAGANQDTKTKEEQWDWATQWSLPKVEVLRTVIPGLFGYRLDTPDGGNYWGAVGRQPGWERHHQGYPRHSGSGEYAGVLVILLAVWAVVQSLRGAKSPYGLRNRQFIWFWSVAALVSLLLAFGRHAPFYQVVYHLPYFSTIRNPIKFMNPFHVAVLILFGYGLQDLCVRYLARANARALPMKQQLAAWWKSAALADKRWTQGLLIVVAASLGALLIYTASRSELERYLTTVAFDAAQAKEIAAFSVREMVWFVFFLAVSSSVVLLIVTGVLTGPRQKLALVLLGLILVVDLGRADQPWVIYYNYKEKYASNSVLDILRVKPEEHRVAARLAPLSPQYLVTGQARELFSAITEDWLQQQYPFYQIQSLDIVQMPRMPEMDSAYMAAIFSPQFSTADFVQLGPLVARLTNRADGASQVLWERFSPEARAALERSGGGQSAAVPLKDALNAISREDSLYDPARFAGVKLSDETRSFLGQNVQSRDLARFNRMLINDAFPAEIAPRSEFASFARLWQLTNTRRILGMGAFLDIMNQQMDPLHRSFQIRTTFDFAPREAASSEGGTRIEDITTVIRPEGQFAIFEFGAALPRAKLYTEWQVVTNTEATLEMLGDLAFDPQRTVLLADPLPGIQAPAANSIQSTGIVAITEYEPKRIRLKAEAAAPSILLWNDKFDPNWNVTVDGKSAALLRCNYIMRGVYVPAGNHEVEFHFKPPHWMFYVSLAAIALGVGLCGLLAFNPGPSNEKRTPAPD